MATGNAWAERPEPEQRLEAWRKAKEKRKAVRLLETLWSPQGEVENFFA